MPVSTIAKISSTLCKLLLQRKTTSSICLPPSYSTPAGVFHSSVRAQIHIRSAPSPRPPRTPEASWGSLGGPISLSQASLPDSTSPLAPSRGSLLAPPALLALLPGLHFTSGGYLPPSDSAVTADPACPCVHTPQSNKGFDPSCSPASK